MSKKKNKSLSTFSLMLKNIRYFVPLLLKLNPLSIISIICNAISQSVSSLIWVLFPKMIIEELMGDQNVNRLIFIVLEFTISIFVLRVINELCGCIQYYYARKASFKIDDMLNEKVASVDYFNIEDPKFADELTYAKQCLNDYSNGIYSVVWTVESLIRNIITFGGVIGIILFSDLPILITLVIVVLSIVSAFINYKINDKYIKIEEDFNKLMVRIRRREWYYNNSMMNFRLQKNLRSYNAKSMIEKYSDATNNDININNKKLSNRLWSIDVGYQVYSYLITRFVIIGVLAYAVYKYNITIAIFTMLFSAITTMNNCIDSLIYSMKSYHQDCVYQDNFINLMNKESIFKDGNQSISHINSIEFRNVSFKYPRTDNYILKNINFVLDNKQKISLVGLNGAGKTTIIKLMCRFYEVEEGEILVNGININLYKHDEYMRQMAVVFQDFKIISFNIKENIANTDDDQDKLYDCLKRAQVLDKVLSLPNKEQTYINKWFDKTGIEFSGGEMQKFAIARALYKDSDLVILDEPTSALDPVAEAEIYYHFNDIVGKKLCLFISHRLSSCIFSDKIMVIDGCSIVEEGTHKELMQNENGLYYKMFTAQAEYYKK